MIEPYWALLFWRYPTVKLVWNVDELADLPISQFYDEAKSVSFTVMNSEWHSKHGSMAPKAAIWKPARAYGVCYGAHILQRASARFLHYSKKGDQRPHRSSQHAACGTAPGASSVVSPTWRGLRAFAAFSSCTLNGESGPLLGEGGFLPVGSLLPLRLEIHKVHENRGAEEVRLGTRRGLGGKGDVEVVRVAAALLAHTRPHLLNHRLPAARRRELLKGLGVADVKGDVQPLRPRPAAARAFDAAAAAADVGADEVLRPALPVVGDELWHLPRLGWDGGVELERQLSTCGHKGGGGSLPRWQCGEGARSVREEVALAARSRAAWVCCRHRVHSRRVQVHVHDLLEMWCAGRKGERGLHGCLTKRYWSQRYFVEPSSEPVAGSCALTMGRQKQHGKSRDSIGTGTPANCR